MGTMPWTVDCDTAPMLIQEPVHEQFSFRPDGRALDRAALLLHGYMGTPAELRPLGEALCRAGIRADAPALPGFGSDIARLGQVNEDDWVDGARAAFATVRDAMAISVLIGFSMGGAVALSVAAQLMPSRLILIEPFQRIPDWRARFLPFVGPVMKEIKPSPDADVALPIASLQALAQVGKASLKAAPRVACPTLIVQARPYTDASFGHPDELVAALSGPTRVEWVDGDHLLVLDDRPSWPRVRDLVVAFALGQEVSL